MIKLYLKTVKISSFLAIVMLITATFLELKQISPFIMNIMLSVFSSLLVVIITSWLQFKHEQQRINKEITIQLKHIVDQLCFFKTIVDYKPPDPIYDGKLFMHRVEILRNIDKMISVCRDMTLEQTYVLKRKKAHNGKVFRSLLMASFPFMSFKDPDFNQKASECIIEIRNAVAFHINLAEKSFYREELEKWISAPDKVA